MDSTDGQNVLGDRDELLQAAEIVRHADEETPRLAVLFYMAGGISAVVVSTIVIALLPAASWLLWLAPIGNAALTVFLIGLFFREYKEASAERKLDTLDAHALRQLQGKDSA